MTGNEKKLRLCTALIAVNLVFIWGNSLLPGDISGEISGWVKDVILAILNLSGTGAEGGHGLLRKLAHFSEFACLGALLCWRLGMKGETGKRLWQPVLLGVLLTACADETIQTMVPDRGPSVIDVWIDTCGGLTGMTALLAGHHYKEKRNNHHHILEETT